MSVGWPEYAKLHHFGTLVADAFGDWPFQVGSSVGNDSKRSWHDVDVVLILADEEHAAMRIGHPDRAGENPRWVALCWAFSELGRSITGLPIDFKIQQRTHANAQHGGRTRNALGTLPYRGPGEGE